ncbi:MAG: SpoIID/LytB domain-containing protein [Aphanocapsa sp. GSE-SYN-MK-11-07L]|nr:SpoIID/LytB domain-containing protein [Aphanocapsa sp. GSE-SYN-MK-11-07L]
MQMKMAARLKTAWSKRPLLLFGLPMGIVTVGVSLLLGQKFLRSQSDPAPALTPPPLKTDNNVFQSGLTNSLSGQNSLPPDLFTASRPSGPTATIPTQSTAPSPSSAAIPNQPVAARPLPPRQVPAAVAPTKGAVPEVRVAIARGAKSLPIGSSTGGYLVNDNGRSLTSLTADQAVTVQPNSQGMLVGDVQVPASIWIKPKAGGLFYLDGRWYRGRLRLLVEADGLTAVNYVDLEQYVSSVVGAEVSPGWPTAALKAQAIAARSYALAHSFRPASRFFDLGNDQRWQVYQGVEDEWNTTHQATNATRGIVLSKDGSVLVSMYAANADIVKNVFGGQGMSQTGAYELAKQGYSYLQILGNYYPGAGLSQIRVQ